MFLRDRRTTLLKHSKIALHVRMQSPPYFEWLRAIQALSAGAVLLCEHAAGHGPLVPGEHFISGSPENLGLLADALLRDPERLDRVRRAGYDAVREGPSMADAARRLVELAEPLAARPVRPVTASRAGAAGGRRRRSDACRRRAGRRRRPRRRGAAAQRPGRRAGGARRRDGRRPRRRERAHDDAGVRRRRPARDGGAGRARSGGDDRRGDRRDRRPGPRRPVRAADPRRRLAGRHAARRRRGARRSARGWPRSCSPAAAAPARRPARHELRRSALGASTC